jgi:uncharacterized protein YbjT (DUF2867 family)
MNVLVTGITGYIGSALTPTLICQGHSVRGFARHPERVKFDVPVVAGDAITGAGLEAALDGIDVAYYLIHSMEPSTDGPYSSRERIAAQRFADAAVAAGVRRIVYLGGLLPGAGAASAHLSSRLLVEGVLLGALPDSVALRASIVIGARSRSFRFLVRLVERLPVVAVPSWQSNRTQPIDERDIVPLLASAATCDAAGGQSLDVGGPDVVSYRELVERIRDLMLIDRLTVGFRRLSVTPIASRIAALIAGEDHELIAPLMESLGTDLLLRDNRAPALLGVRMHSLDAAIEHSLAEWERHEPLAAR